MRQICLIGMFWVLSSLGVMADSSVQPSTELSPENVISIQLKALSDAQNDPKTDSGAAQVWAFAHPSNRSMTGPLTRFTRMLKSPNYKALIGHQRHFLRLISQTDDTAHFAIKVTDRIGTVYGYSWQLTKVPNGAYANMWMTTTVMLVGKLGQQL